MTAPDHYATLGAERNADPATLKANYRRAAMESHPDRNPGDPEAPARFAAIQEAWEVLSDPDRRARYDATGGDSALTDEMLDKQATDLVMTSLLNALDATSQNPQMDPVGSVRAHLSNERNASHGMVLQATQVSQRLEAVLPTLLCADGAGGWTSDHAVSRAMKGKIRTAYASISSANDRIRTIDRALQLLASFRYDPNAGPGYTPPSYIRDNGPQTRGSLNL
jgi:hypothetical protein